MEKKKEKDGETRRRRRRRRRKRRSMDGDHDHHQMTMTMRSRWLGPNSNRPVVPQVIDTVDLWSLEGQRKISLRFLASQLLGACAMRSCTMDDLLWHTQAVRPYRRRSVSAGCRSGCQQTMYMSNRWPLIGLEAALLRYVTFSRCGLALILVIWLLSRGEHPGGDPRLDRGRAHGPAPLPQVPRVQGRGPVNQSSHDVDSRL
jgi:hypothetical protein